MIASLRGQVAALAADSVIVDVAGVGYRVFVPTSTITGLGVGVELLLHTHLVVRENEMALFGATEPEALALFLQLLTVNGVGPRLALAMLSAMPAPALAEAIATEDVDTLTRVNGVGRKTAQRVILDLRSKIDGWSDGAGVGGPVAGLSSPDAEALAALAALGYTLPEARRALATAGVAAEASVETRVFAALRVLGGG
jgi:Holliday junction DNA helicase RuvA